MAINYVPVQCYVKIRFIAFLPSNFDSNDPKIKTLLIRSIQDDILDEEFNIEQVMGDTIEIGEILKK